MTLDDPIEAWLTALRRRLRYDPLLARRVVREVADHLTDAAAAEERAGASPLDSRRRAVERFGTPDAFVAGLPRRERILRIASLVAATATIDVGLFIIVAMRWLIPAAESSTLPLWTAAAIGTLLYGAATWIFLTFPVRGDVRTLLAYCSGFALMGALWSLFSTIDAGRATGDWDLYVLSFAGIVGAQAVTVLAFLYRIGMTDCAPAERSGN